MGTEVGYTEKKTIYILKEKGIFEKNSGESYKEKKNVSKETKEISV